MTPPHPLNSMKATHQTAPEPNFSPVGSLKTTLASIVLRLRDLTITAMLGTLFLGSCFRAAWLQGEAFAEQDASHLEGSQVHQGNRGMGWGWGGGQSTGMVMILFLWRAERQSEGPILCLSGRPGAGRSFRPPASFLQHVCIYRELHHSRPRACVCIRPLTSRGLEG